LFTDPRWTGERVLEIGFGIETGAINLARHGARVTAVDLSEQSPRCFAITTDSCLCGSSGILVGTSA